MAVEQKPGVIRNLQCDCALEQGEGGLEVPRNTATRKPVTDCNCAGPEAAQGVVHQFQTANVGALVTFAPPAQDFY